jgi:C_GCAxxG_C_C family probable redox protein
MFLKGYSCAQAVLAACAPEIGLEKAQALRLAGAMGAGLCGMRETCGAVLAMVMVWGSRFAPTSPMEAKEKARLYAQGQALIARFDAEHAMHNCKALLQQASIEKQAGVAPEARTAAYYAQRPCVKFVATCARLAMMDPEALGL